MRLLFWAKTCAILNLLSVVLASCPEEYIRYHKEHTGCKPKNDQCEMIDSGIHDGDIETILKLHNDYRSQIATGKAENLPKGANILQLEWDEELAKVAQSHANQCTDEHDCKPCRRSKHYEVGQNIFIGEVDSPERNYKEAIDSFFDEKEDFNNVWLKDFDPSGTNGPVGHFSQLAWAKSRNVGCGYAAFKKDGSNSEVVVCNYGPGGNFLHQPVYIEGDACSKCPENTCCGNSCSRSPKYDGLCQVEKGKVPRYPRGTKGMYFCDFTDMKACGIVPDKKGKSWTVENTLSGNRYFVVLNGGESTGFKISKNFPKSGGCIIVEYTKGPNKASEKGKGGNEARLGLNFVGMNPRLAARFAPKINLQDSDTLISHEVKLHFPRPAQVSFTFKAKNGPAQYMRLHTIFVSKDECE